ncbi:hypothetical protein CTAYLR_002688 [Chrysophaeum taylorii]|uniref:Gamma-tocopherol methyltransferase n=1 Tax=Chrysophaeum taylorii TaxID=2483200 RepID=A0AAD7XHP8_9STRA|nr:hypothetical protein CTAYLR_002688 [Chrysophaeum taylorii]
MRWCFNLVAAVVVAWAPPPTPRWRRPRAVAADPDAALKSGIAGFYDGLSGLWEQVWGEHLHHGYYEPNAKGLTLEAHKEAQVDMIDRVLEWARVAPPPTCVLDVGCGIGGASRHIARRFPTSRVTGITLSPVQAARATTLSEGLACEFRVQDTLALPEDWSGKHDLVWSLESGEHVPNKPRFVDNLVRTCAPGGTVVLVTWCHRDLKPGESNLTPFERLLLAVINSCYWLPKWCSVADYNRLFEDRGMLDIRRDDWTPNIAPFWPAVIKTAANPRNGLKLVRTGLDGVRSALAMFLMVLGYKMNLIKFGLITARKPLLQS